MATNPRTRISDQANFKLVKKESKNRQKPSGAVMGRLLSTLLALVLLAVVLRYLPPGSRNAQAKVGNHLAPATPDDVRLGNVQMGWAPAGEALYLDGVITNTGEHNVTGATMQVDFHDEQGKVVSSIQKPIVGMAHGGIDLVRNEFARNPIQPNEMRFFRIAIDQVPSAWNHEVPDLKITGVSAR